VLDPLGIVPIYIALTEKMESRKRVEISRTATLTAAGLLFAFAIAGTQIFAIFGITLYGFMVAGGVLLFIVAIQLLTGGERSFIARDQAGDTGVVPLAFPLLAGPGAITAVIITLESSGLLLTVLSILAVIGITYVILKNADKIYLVLGKRGAMIISRVFAVFIAAIAVQYIVQGIKALF
jgi:multiple antibiotic resistance protein